VVINPYEWVFARHPKARSSWMAVSLTNGGG